MLAKKLSEQFNIPAYELDCIVYNESGETRYKRTPDEQVEVIKEIDKQSHWIIESTYGKSCHVLFKLADVILYLDTPLWLRKFRIFKRYIKQQLHIEKSQYKSDFCMLKLMYKWTRDFEENRQEFENMLNECKGKLIISNDVKAAFFKIAKRSQL
jgi:adenylate kinase family enzyme